MALAPHAHDPERREKLKEIKEALKTDAGRSEMKEAWNIDQEPPVKESESPAMDEKQKAEQAEEQKAKASEKGK